MDECDLAKSDSEQHSVSLPDGSLASCGASTVTYQRRFNRPTGLSESMVVQLHSELLILGTVIRFNGESLPVPRDPFIDLSDHLKPHNWIEIVIARPQFQLAATASAKIEIQTRTNTV